MKPTDKLKQQKPWAIIGCSRKRYESARPWARAGVSREEFERIVQEIPAEFIKALHLEADVDRLVEGIFSSNPKQKRQI